MAERPLVIDGLQYCNWSEKIFREMQAGGVSAVHATICYHENFRETGANIEAWNRWFERFAELICHGKTADDIRRAHAEGRTAIVFGFQNCSPIEDDIGLVGSAMRSARASCSSATTTSRCSRPAATRPRTRASPAWAAR